MIGTIVNTCTILAGSLIGGTLKKVISPRISDALFTAMGLAAFILGINAAVQNMPNSTYPVLFIASLALGGGIGTALKLSERMERATSKKTDKHAQAAQDEQGTSGEQGEQAALDEQDAMDGEQIQVQSAHKLSDGLITGCLLFCVGTLSILGPVQSALYGDATFLFTNAMLDFVTSMVLASTYGIGMCLAAPVLFIWQGAIFCLTLLLGDFISGAMMTELSIVGGVLIMMSGISILKLKDVKTLNFLPALIFPVLWCLIAPLFGL